MSETRVDKTNYYLDIAETVAERGTCLRKNYGCIIVKSHIATINGPVILKIKFQRII